MFLFLPEAFVNNFPFQVLMQIDKLKSSILLITSYHLSPLKEPSEIKVNIIIIQFL